MRVTRDLRHDDVAVLLVQLVLASIAGLVLTPGVLDGPARAVPPGEENLVAAGWLAIGLAISAWLVVLAPAFARLLGDAVATYRRRLPGDAPGDLSASARHLARWLVAFGEILLIQAMLRPPLVVLLGAAALSRANAEALVAALTLAVLLLVLVWVHRSARPLVATAARSTLDVFLASTNSDTTVLATSRLAATTQRRPQLTDEAATRPVPALEATVAAEPDAPTLPAVPGETLLAPSNATLVDPNATLPGFREDADRTLGGGQ
ncbi:MAG TPA: hypothetical protein VFZ25_15005 [Chloroflexota bacterium]|nr:hypothetical protein [Chloroflexota bacterium]